MSGTCSDTLQSVGYPVESVFLRGCDPGRRLCQVTVRVRVTGEAQLQEALQDISTAWGERYGTEYQNHHRNTVPGAESDDCIAALGEGRYGCLLRGTATFVRDWVGMEQGGLATGQRAQLVVTGSAGSQVAGLRMTLATADGIEESRERDL